MPIERELNKRFENLRTLIRDGETYFFIESPGGKACNILMTSGLSEYEMVVEDSQAQKTHKELYFLLPDYWSHDVIDQKKYDWLFETLYKLKCHVVAKNTFYAEGHTMHANKNLTALSDQLKQTYLMLCNPIYVNDELTPIIIGSKEISFLGIFPIFRNEFHHKQAYGTTKLMDLFDGYQVTEKLDEYRTNLVKSRWRRLFG